MAEPATSARPLVEALNVSKVFATKTGLLASFDHGFVRAVDRVTLTVDRGEIVGLVGESGSGKSTLGRLMIRLTAVTAGEVRFDGRDITELRGRALRRARKHMQLIFQDSAGSLDPRYTVQDTLAEVIATHASRQSAAERDARIAEVLDMVRLSPSTRDRYPRELSAGQRQAVSIARALAVSPSFIVADEPISSLDATAQVQIVQLLEQLQAELGLSLLLISHDLDLVERLSRRVAVMYLGRLVELADASSLFAKPLHPYTRALIAANLPIDPTARRRPVLLQGDPPSPLNPPKGCPFHPRCPHRDVRCTLLEPPWREVTPGHFVFCHFDL